MAHRFDVVPIRADDEGGIVVRMIVRTQTRSTVVLAPGLQGRMIEVIDLLSSVGMERDMKRGRLLLGLVQAQRGASLTAEFDAV